jgi:hypothetical protein
MSEAWKCDENGTCRAARDLLATSSTPESPATLPFPLAGISLPVAATCPRIEVR